MIRRRLMIALAVACALLAVVCLTALVLTLGGQNAECGDIRYVGKVPVCTLH